ncbi:hypothetical protein [Microbacterium sp.]|uniref:hypothetical protein n=1 Tax=Microbacterium sp. TaxID=51671 RepID=UPI003F6F43EC
MPDHAIDAIFEIFTWVGLGAGAFVAIVAVIAKLADGTWVPAQAVIADDPDGRVARWFGHEGRVGSARLTHEQHKELAGRETADVYVRLGRDDRMRLTKGSPLVRLLMWLAIGLGAVGALAAVGSIVMLFVR